MIRAYLQATRVASCAAVLFLSLTGGGQAASYSATPTLVLAEPTPVIDNTFSLSLLGEGGELLASAIGDFDMEPGVVYLFDAVTGGVLQTYENPSSFNDNFFGGNLAFAGGNVVVSASEDSTVSSFAGRVYLFDRDLENVLGEFGSPAPGFFNEFGSALATLGVDLLIGEEGADPGDAQEAGAVYLFDADPGSATFGNLLRTFTKPTPVSGDSFGAAVAVVQGNVVVGAPRDSKDGNQAGAAYIFSGGTGALLATLDNPTPSDFDRFGSSVGVVGDNVIVGAPLDGPGPKPGAAYLFDGDSSSPTFGDLLLTLPNPAAGHLDWFGFSVAGVGADILVGAFFDATVAPDAGAAHLFDGDPLSPTFGNLLQTFTKPAAVGNEWFGYSLSSAGGSIAIGAQFDDPGGVMGAGAVYLFGNTATGDPDPIEIVADDGTPVEIDFDSVTTPGSTFVEAVACPDPDANFQLCETPTCLDISSTAATVGNIRVCITYPDGCAANEADIRLLHEGVDVSELPVDEANNRVCGNTSSLSVFSVAVADSDGDGVPDSGDMCSGTVIPESVPSQRHGRNRWALVDDDSAFDTDGGNAGLSFDVEDTGGCSCEQIIEAQSLGSGHAKFGCSTSVMLTWIGML